MVEEDVTLMRVCNLDPNRIMDDGAIGSAPEGAKSDAKRGRLVGVVKYCQRILTIGKDGKSAFERRSLRNKFHYQPIG